MARRPIQPDSKLIAITQRYISSRPPVTTREWLLWCPEVSDACLNCKLREDLVPCDRWSIHTTHGPLSSVISISRFLSLRNFLLQFLFYFLVVTRNGAMLWLVSVQNREPPFELEQYKFYFPKYDSIL